MNLIPIFTEPNSDGGLWSIQLNNDSPSEFEKFFSRINKVEWLHDFFEENKADLYSGYFGIISMTTAISRTLEEAEEMENSLYDYARQGHRDSRRQLQHLFRPLNNFEYVIGVHHPKT